jgi:hypothetical protein
MRPFIIIPLDVFEELDSYETRIYLSIKKFVGKEGTAYPSVKTISKLANVSETKVKNVIKYLALHGYLTIKKRKKKDGTSDSNVYSFINHDPKKEHINDGEKTIEGAHGDLGRGHNTPNNYNHINYIKKTKAKKRLSTGKTNNAHNNTESFSFEKIDCDLNKSVLDCSPTNKDVDMKKILVERAQINDIFEFWKREMNHPKAKLDDKRIKKIKKAINLGYLTNQLKDAICGCKASPFHQGQNANQTKYDEITLILRDASHIEKFISYLTNPPTSTHKKYESIESDLKEEDFNKPQLCSLKDISSDILESCKRDGMSIHSLLKDPSEEPQWSRDAAMKNAGGL